MSPHPEPPPEDTLAPVVATCVVRASATAAFVGFTEQLGSWWDPRLTPDAATYRGAEVEPHAGGAVRLVHDDGAYEIARVTTWEPGARLGLDFWLALDRDHPTTVVVDFTPETDGSRVTLVHGGWGPHNRAHRAKFTEWSQLLDRLAAHLDV